MPHHMTVLISTRKTRVRAHSGNKAARRFLSSTVSGTIASALCTVEQVQIDRYSSTPSLGTIACARTVWDSRLSRVKGRSQ